MTARNLVSMPRWSNVGRMFVAAATCFSLLAAARAEEKRPANPREMFRVLGVGDTYFERLTGGIALDADEIDPMLRILYKLRRFPALDLERWAADADKLNEALKQSGKFRGLLRSSICHLRRWPSRSADRSSMARGPGFVATSSPYAIPR